MATSFHLPSRESRRPGLLNLVLISSLFFTYVQCVVWFPATPDMYEYEWGPECRMPIQVNHDRRLPNGRWASSYPDLQKLCAAAHHEGDPNSNLGGTCVVLPGRQAETGLVLGPPFGDPTLYGDQILRIQCQLYCECELPLGWTDEWIEAAKASSKAKGVGRRKETFTNEDVHKGQSSYTYIKPPPGGFQEMYRLSIGDERNGKKPFLRNKKGRCDARSDCQSYGCGWTGIGDCKCLALGFNPDKGEFAATACGSTASRMIGMGGTSGLGKRAVEKEIMACPCNQTYVSEACCHSPSRLVWEDPELKLGEISSAVSRGS